MNSDILLQRLDRATNETMRTTARQPRPAGDLAAELLELFYLVHYKGGMALEDAMRGGQLTRKQVAILWLIRKRKSGTAFSFCGAQSRLLSRRGLKARRIMAENGRCVEH